MVASGVTRRCQKNREDPSRYRTSQGLENHAFIKGDELFIAIIRL